MQPQKYQVCLNYFSPLLIRVMMGFVFLMELQKHCTLCLDSRVVGSGPFSCVQIDKLQETQTYDWSCK